MSVTVDGSGYEFLYFEKLTVFSQYMVLSMDVNICTDNRTIKDMNLHHLPLHLPWLACRRDDCQCIHTICKRSTTYGRLPAPLIQSNLAGGEEYLPTRCCRLVWVVQDHTVWEESFPQRELLCWEAASSLYWPTMQQWNNTSKTSHRFSWKSEIK